MKHNRDYFDSDEEFMFYCWLIEAKSLGIIDSFQIKPVTIDIFDSVPYTYDKENISKVKKIRTVKKINGTLLNEWKYTPDFIVTGDLSKFHTGTHKLTMPLHSYMGASLDSYVIDTKGTGGKNKDDKNFSKIQKALYHSKGIYANKLVPKSFFKNAWLPMPVLKKGDLIWTDYKVLKNGTIKPQRKRAAFSKCKTFKEQYKKIIAL